MLDMMPQRHQSTKGHKDDFQPIDPTVEGIAKMIVDAAYKVHINLGPGLLEKVYEICFCHELEKRGIGYLRQVNIPIVYDNLTFEDPDKFQRSANEGWSPAISPVTFVCT